MVIRLERTAKLVLKHSHPPLEVHEHVHRMYVLFIYMIGIA